MQRHAIRSSEPRLIVLHERQQPNRCIAATARQMCPRVLTSALCHGIPMSPMGHSRRFRDVRSTSGLRPKAEIKADIRAGEQDCATDNCAPGLSTKVPTKIRERSLSLVRSSYFPKVRLDVRVIFEFSPP